MSEPGAARRMAGHTKTNREGGQMERGTEGRKERIVEKEDKWAVEEKREENNLELHCENTENNAGDTE